MPPSESFRSLADENRISNLEIAGVEMKPEIKELIKKAKKRVKSNSTLIQRENLYLMYKSSLRHLAGNQKEYDEAISKLVKVLKI